MMSSVRAAVSVAALSILGFAAVANAQGVTNPKPFEGRFALYTEPGHVPSPGCDRGTSLVLDSGTLTGEFAVLENFVSGRCRLFVSPDTRFVQLTQVDESCGSKFYEGVVRTDKGPREIAITDHRNRLCRDLVPAKVIVTEKYQGVESTLYSTFHTSSF